MKNSDSEKIIRLLSESYIFRGVPREMLESAAKSGESNAADFQKGEVIFNRDNYRHSLGLILSGSAKVCKGKGEHRIIMSTLTEGSIFGAITLYSDFDYYVTEITALSKCRIFFMNKNLISNMIKEDISISENYISYLSERIYFLNSKIDSFTGGSAESKLALYLIGRMNDDENGGQSVHLNFSLTQLAEVLDIGRASLYRALDDMTAGGIIKREGRTVYILQKDKLSAVKA